MDTSFIGQFFPQGLLEHFTITQVLELCNIEDKSQFFKIYLEENNVILGDVDPNLYESKGFTEITLQDFPIRGKAVFLVIKRRRWRLKLDKKATYRNDFSFVSAGSGFTQELSDFLKYGHQYW